MQNTEEMIGSSAKGVKDFSEQMGSCYLVTTVEGYMLHPNAGKTAFYVTTSGR